MSLEDMGTSKSISKRIRDNVAADIDNGFDRELMRVGLERNLKELGWIHKDATVTEIAIIDDVLHVNVSLIIVPEPLEYIVINITEVP